MTHQSFDAIRPLPDSKSTIDPIILSVYNLYARHTYECSTWSCLLTCAPMSCSAFGSTKTTHVYPAA